MDATNNLVSVEDRALACTTRESIKALEAIMATMPNQVVSPTRHVFAKGAYMRCIHMSKGTITTSKIHKTQHISVVVSGDVTIAKADGTQERVTGPHIFVTEPNTKRAIVVNEDTMWITFHVTDKTDLASIEADVITEDYLQ